MVKVIFKLSEIDPVHLNITEPDRLDNILHICEERTGVTFGGIITIRKGKVITAADNIYDGDEIEVFPAISGG